MLPGLFLPLPGGKIRQNTVSGQIQLQRGDGDEAFGQRSDIGTAFRNAGGSIAADPVIGATARVNFFILKVFTGYPYDVSARYPLQKQPGLPKQRSRIKRSAAWNLQIKNRRRFLSKKEYQTGLNKQQRIGYRIVMI